jgi:hypothetical protein
MSIELHVYLREESLPTRAEWQAAIDRGEGKLVIDEFAPRAHSGFLPCRLNGVECGFEYSFDPLPEQDEALRKPIGNRDRVVTLVLQGSLDDLRAAMYGAAALTELSDGVYFDPQSGEFAIGRGVYDLIRRDEDADRARRRRAAEKDSGLTDQRCSHCGAAFPAYRKTCKGCGVARSGG